tara:strand:- start:1808 stop:2188 length:381 start_codon:yes stop_codon:yes gene_type:complete
MDFREKAFNNFYEYYISNNTSKDEFIENHTELSNNQSIRYKQLVINTLDNLDTISLFISDSSANWTFERIMSVEKVCLILGISELSMKLTKKEIVVSEWVKISDLHGTKSGAKFVNGVLEDVYTKL